MTSHGSSTLISASIHCWRLINSINIDAIILIITIRYLRPEFYVVVQYKVNTAFSSRVWWLYILYGLHKVTFCTRFSEDTNENFDMNVTRSLIPMVCSNSPDTHFLDIINFIHDTGKKSTYESICPDPAVKYHSVTSSWLAFWQEP